MNNFPDSESGFFLFPADFSAYDACLHEAVDPESIEDFDTRIGGYEWGIRFNGLICSVALSYFGKVPLVNFHIDFNDKTTVHSFNLLPKFFEQELTLKQTERFCLNVVYSSGTIVKPWTSTDAIIISGGNLCLRDYLSNWKKMSDAHDKVLMREIKSIQDKLT